MVLPSDPAEVRGQLREIAAAYDPGMSPGAARGAASPELAPGDPPMFILGQDQAAIAAAMAAGERAEEGRQAEGLGYEVADPGPLRQPGDYRS